MYIKIYITDIWQDKTSKEEFNPVKVEAKENGEFVITLKSIKTQEVVTKDVERFRYDFEKIQQGKPGSKSFYI